MARFKKKKEEKGNRKIRNCMQNRLVLKSFSDEIQADEKEKNSS